MNIPSTLDELEERVIEVHALWWRSPGEPKWPYAGDAPWHLMVRDLAVGDYGGDGVDGASSSVRPRPPLDTAEVDERDRVTAWLRLAGEPVDAKIIWVATRQLQKGEPGVPWAELKRWLRYDRTPTALVYRYKQAMARVLCAINAWPENRVRRLAQGWDLRDWAKEERVMVS